MFERVQKAVSIYMNENNLEFMFGSFRKGLLFHLVIYYPLLIGVLYVIFSSHPSLK